MEQGQFEQRIFALLKGTSNPLPDKIKNKPRLRPGLAFFWVAFLTLSSERQTGFGVGRIPWSKAMDYLDRIGRFSAYEQTRFWTVLSGMDSAFVKHHNDKSKTDAGPTGGSTPSPQSAPRKTPRARRRR